jgi:hypothetical protein
MGLLRSLLRLAAALPVVSLLNTAPAAAQAQLGSEPGIAMIAPATPVEPADSAKALEKRTDVANAKLPTLAQAVHDEKRLPKHDGPAAPKSDKTAPPPQSPSASH